MQRKIPWRFGPRPCSAFPPRPASVDRPPPAMAPLIMITSQQQDEWRNLSLALRLQPPQRPDSLCRLLYHDKVHSRGWPAVVSLCQDKVLNRASQVVASLCHGKVLSRALAVVASHCHGKVLSRGLLALVSLCQDKDPSRASLVASHCHDTTPNRATALNPFRKHQEFHRITRHYSTALSTTRRINRPSRQPSHGRIRFRGPSRPRHLSERNGTWRFTREPVCQRNAHPPAPDYRCRSELPLRDGPLYGKRPMVAWSTSLHQQQSTRSLLIPSWPFSSRSNLMPSRDCNRYPLQ